MSDNFIKKIVAYDDDGHVVIEPSIFTKTADFVLLGKEDWTGESFYRFTNITISKGAIIESATLNLYYLYGEATTANVRIRCVNADNPSTTPNSFSEFNSLSLIDEYVDWSVVVSSTGIYYASPDIKTIIQAIVNRENWESGNSLIIVLKNNSSPAHSSRYFASFDWQYYDPNPPYDPLYQREPYIDINIDTGWGQILKYDGVEQIGISKINGILRDNFAKLNKISV